MTCPACERPHGYGTCVAWYFVYEDGTVLLHRAERSEMCPACRVTRGEYHHVDCTLLACPRCHAPVKMCECRDGEKPVGVVRFSEALPLYGYLVESYARMPRHEEMPALLTNALSVLLGRQGCALTSVMLNALVDVALQVILTRSRRAAGPMRSM